MKISKIACVALLGASFAVSSAFATPQSNYDGAVLAKKNAIKNNTDKQKEKADAFNNVMTQVKVLQGIKGLKDWNGTATSTDPEKEKTFKKISDAVAAIKDELDKIKPASGSLELVAADDTSKLTIDSTGAVKVNIDGNGGKQEATGDVTLDFANPVANTAEIAKIFSDKNANVWNEFVKAFADEHAKLVKERDEKLADDIKITLDPAIQTAAVALATAETTTPTYEGTVKNYDALNDALKNDVAAKEKALAEKQADFTKKTDELNKAIAAAPEIKVKDDVATQKNDIDAAEALIAAANTDPLKKAFVEAAINAGVKVQKDGKELKSTDSEADLIAAFDTAKTNTEKAKENIAKIDAAKTAATAAEAAIAAPKAAVESAKNALTDFESKASDKTGVAELARTELASYKDNLDPKKAGSEAKKIADATKAKAEKEKDLAAAVKAFKEGANKDKVALKGTDADSIKAQLEAITKAETDIGAAGASEEKQKAAIKAAIEAGVPVANGTKKLSASDVAGLDAAGLAAALASATTNTTAAKNAVTTDLNTQVTAVKDQDTIIENSTKAIADQKAKVKEISNTRAKAIATSENLDKGESDVLTALSDVFDSNARVESIIVGESADDVAEGVSELHSTLDTATKSLNKGNFTDIVIFNTNLATNTRLAKLSNPYNGNLALAYAVKNMAGEKFADNGSDALSSVVKEYTNRYNYDNNLWG